MGNYFRAKQKLAQEYKENIKKNEQKFSKINKMRVLFVGPSGKHNFCFIFAK